MIILLWQAVLGIAAWGTSAIVLLDEDGGDWLDEDGGNITDEG